MNIKNNPADDLSQHVEKEFASKFNGQHNIRLMTRRCLPVKQSDVEECVGNFEKMIQQELGVNQDHKFLIIHIGVNGM